MTSRATRVLVVDAVGEVGGAQASLLTFLRHHRRADLECRVILLEDGPLRLQIQSLGVSCVVGPAKPRLRDVGGAISIIREIRCQALSWPATVVYANGTLAHMYASPAAAAAHLPYVWRLCDMLRRGTGPVYRIAAHLPASLVIADSDAVCVAARRFRRNFPSLLTVYPGAETQQKPPAGLREELHLDDGPMVAVVGRLQRWKGQADAIQAMPHILAKHPDSQMVIAGGTLFGLDREYPHELRQLVNELGLEPRVHLLGHRDDASAIMSEADVLVVPSRDPEPFGTVQVEAMMQSVAVVSTNHGGNREVVEDGVTGYLTPPAEPLALADAIVRLLSDPDARRRMGARGRDRALRMFSAETMTDRLEEALRSVAVHPRDLRHAS